LSKAARLELIRNNLAKSSNDFDEIDRQHAYAVWLIEKEFHVGVVSEDFLLLKFWNLWDDDNVRMYNESLKRGDSDVPHTMGA
jgi:hypothetical protein